MKTQQTTCEHTGEGLRVAIVSARFNRDITQRLYDGCYDELVVLGVSESDIETHWVPGSFELPIVAQSIARRQDVDAVMCLGVIIRGDTYHFELVADATAYGIHRVALTTETPIIFGVLSTDNVEQALVRSQDKGENKGRDAARAAVEMVRILQALDVKTDG
jgi:6,7-dimethyl-8-ribityllumazine synthase